MVLLHVKKADDLQMLVLEHHLNSLPSLLLPQSGPQVEVPASTPLSEAIPHVANLWNTMLKMRKLADCCNDLATYAPHSLNPISPPRTVVIPRTCNRVLRPCAMFASCVLQLRRIEAAC